VQGLGFANWPHIALQALGDTSEVLAYEDEITAADDEEALYKSAHIGSNLGYQVAVPNGSYDVRLHFAEIAESVDADNPRVVDWLIQGETVVADFDLVAERGFAQAVTLTATGVEVTDGTLRLESVSHQNVSLLSGFDVRESIELLPTDLSLDVSAEDALDPAQTIRIKGDMGGWTGVEPESIRGVRNPTLVLQEGETYTMEWRNVDGVYHNVALASEGLGQFFFVSSGVTGVDETEIVEFTAAEGMGAYLCTPHPEDMLGRIRVVDGS